MKKAQEIFDILKSEFDDAIISISTETPTEPMISVDPLKICGVSLFLRNNTELQFDSLMNLSGVDDADRKSVV